MSDQEKKIAFIDMEASGLGHNSWPIEVGWGFHGRAPRASLIKPADNWPLASWEKTAEDLHKISIDQLLREGIPALEVALVLNATLEDADVYSDAPDYDGFWLYRLFESAGVTAKFNLLDLKDLLEPLNVESPQDIVKAAQAREPHTHRAAQDVKHMQLIYSMALAEHESAA